MNRTAITNFSRKIRNGGGGYAMTPKCQFETKTATSKYIFCLIHIDICRYLMNYLAFSEYVKHINNMH